MHQLNSSSVSDTCVCYNRSGRFQIFRLKKTNLRCPLGKAVHKNSEHCQSNVGGIILTAGALEIARNLFFEILSDRRGNL